MSAMEFEYFLVHILVYVIHFMCCLFYYFKSQFHQHFHTTNSRNLILIFCVNILVYVVCFTTLTSQLHQHFHTTYSIHSGILIFYESIYQHMLYIYCQLTRNLKVRISEYNGFSFHINSPQQSIIFQDKRTLSPS